jgi:hypothetical protein
LYPGFAIFSPKKPPTAGDGEGDCDGELEGLKLGLDEGDTDALGDKDGDGLSVSSL